MPVEGSVGFTMRPLLDRMQSPGNHSSGFYY